MERQNVKEVIRHLLEERGEISSAEIQDATGLTRQAVHYHLQPLVRAGEIEQLGRGRGARYQLPQRRTTRYPISGLEEHRVWKEMLQADPRLQELPSNVRAIHNYAFTEMLNNAIDHSKGRWIDVSKYWTDDRLTFEIDDDGVGAFRKVREKFGLPDDFAALQEISKGKTTTDPEHHTGQGLFFTSKAVDHFMLEANGLRWRIDNLVADQAVGDASRTSGTRVLWSLDNPSKRILKDVFDAYADPEVEGFSRSRAVVSLFKSGDSFVSRSEAKRISRGLERFREVIVDFSGVREVGQGFVDELFRVWASDHPEVRLTPTNMSSSVEAMVRRGLPPRQ
jgi:anti-sigma regulatory factor (Ser/Thr protein kinase)